MIKYPICKMTDQCQNDAQVYHEKKNKYVCQDCSMLIDTDDSQVDLPLLSKANNALEYSMYTITQMKDFIL